MLRSVAPVNTITILCLLPIWACNALRAILDLVLKAGEHGHALLKVPVVNGVACAQSALTRLFVKIFKLSLLAFVR